MLFQFFHKDSCSYSYLLADNIAGSAIIIDPVLEDVNLYLQRLEQWGCQLIFSIETHVHADHITGAFVLRRKTGCDILVAEQANVKNSTREIQDNEVLNYGNSHIQAIYTPGHTPDSYCFYTDGIIFTGDTLLIRATGRTDFQNGCSIQAYDSLFHKILTLADSTIIYPGHDYCGVSCSTIAEERRYNPRLQVADCEEYAKIMNNLNLPKPKLFDIAVPANLDCGEV